jgi:hypothetical protein
LLRLKCFYRIIPNSEPAPSNAEIKLTGRAFLDFAFDEDSPGINLMVRLDNWPAVAPATSGLDVFPN